MVSGQNTVNGRIVPHLVDQMEPSIDTEHVLVDSGELHVKEIQQKRGAVIEMFHAKVNNF